MTTLVLTLLLGGDPTLDGRVGYSGMIYHDSWAPVTVEAWGASGAVEGELEVAPVAWGGMAQTVYRRELVLPRGGRKRVRLAVYLTGWEHRVDVRLIDREGRERARTRIPIRAFDDAERQVMVVGALPGSLALVEKPLDLAMARLGAEEFPRTVQPLLAADAIIFAEPPRLDPGQADALRRWVAAGGRLVYSRGRESERYRQGIWKELCPVAAGDTESVPVQVEGESVLVPLVRAEGPSLLSVAGRPAVFSGRWGRGEVVFVAFPLDQARIEKVASPRALWGRIFRVIREEEEDALEEFQFGSRMLIHHGSEVFIGRFEPGAGYVNAAVMTLAGGLLAIHVLLAGPLTYRWLKRRGRLPAAWKILLCSVVLFGAASLLWGGHITPSRTRVTHVSLADPNLVRTFTALRAGRTGTYRVRSPGMLAAVSSSPAIRGRAAPARVEPDGALHFSLRGLDTRTFLSTRPARPAEFEVSCRWGGKDRKRLQVRNAGTLDLRNCRLVMANRVYKLGDLFAGTEHTVELATLTSWKPSDYWESLGGWKIYYRSFAFPGDPWDQAEVLTFYQRIAESHRYGNDRYRLRLRGLDLSPVIDEGGAVFLGHFREDRSKVELDVPADVDARGLLRVVVEDAKP